MSQPVIHSHSYQHFEDLQLSAQNFYTMLETMIRDYQYPGVEVKRETLKESGFFSSSREYLRISKRASNYYVCASPFGKSFFISWWLKEQEDGLANVVDKVPLFGGLLSGKNRPKTFYELDSELMFTQSIHSIIQAAVNKVLADHGFRTKAKELPV
jgi:hypothetical protein